MPKKESATKQFLSLEGKNSRRFFNFFTLPKQTLFSLDNWFLKAKNLSNNLLGNTPRQLKMLPILIFYMSYSQARR